MRKRLNTKDLEGQKLADMSIGDVASTRRDPQKEPLGGWQRGTKTLVEWHSTSFPKTSPGISVQHSVRNSVKPPLTKRLVGIEKMPVKMPRPHQPGLRRDRRNKKGRVRNETFNAREALTSSEPPSEVEQKESLVSGTRNTPQTAD